MAGTFKFELVTPERMALSEDVGQVVVPGIEGEFTVLAGHAPVISVLRPGIIDVTLPDASKTRIFVRGGFAEVDADHLTVLAERASMSRWMRRPSPPSSRRRRRNSRSASDTAGSPPHRRSSGCARSRSSGAPPLGVPPPHAVTAIFL